MEERQKLRERVDTRIASALDRRLVDRLLSEGSGGRWAPAALVSRALATFVHLTVTILLLGGLYLLVLGANPVQRVAGVVVLLPVLLLVRRRTDIGAVAVTPEDAPALTALVAQVADALGTPPPTYIGIDEDVNAYAARVGLRTRALVLGAPFWVALSPQGRVALLGHELGHFAGRDVVHGRYVGTAMRTVEAWLDAATPDPTVTTLGHTPIVTTIALWPFRAAATAYLHALLWASAAASRRAELLADTHASTVAGTTATVEILEMLLLDDVIERAANRAAVDPRRPDLAVEIRDRVAGLTPADRRAARREADRSRVDRTHPPTVDRLRLRLQESLPPSPPLLALDADRAAAIDAELEPHLRTALLRTADGYR